MSLIVGFDPGGTTGYATYGLNTDTWDFGELTGSHGEALWRLLDMLRPEYVVSERFDKRPNAPAAEIMSRGYQEVIATWCSMSGRELHLQSASDAKTVWSDKKLTKLAAKYVWIPPKSPAHRRDAMRHVLLFLQKSPLLDYRFVRLATFPGNSSELA